MDCRWGSDYLSSSLVRKRCRAAGCSLVGEKRGLFGLCGNNSLIDIVLPGVLA